MQHKWHYQDESERRKWQNPESILKRIGLKTGQTLVDIGCGEGFFALPAARIVGRAGLIYAGDISTEALETLQRKAEIEKLENILISAGAAEELTMCEGCADIVFMPIAIFKAGNQHSSCTLAGCMNKCVVIDINADMRERVAVGIKENQIA